MKKIEANRYPHAATLFRFCKEALEIRYEGNVKVIDQDVGAILGYDPADCSHWKKGKKNIRSLPTLRTIADHFNVDERLMIDIAAGKIGLEEAVFEFRGYGSFALNGKYLENLKKEYFKNPTRWQNEGTSRSFEELFDIDRPAIAKMVQTILATGNFKEAPIYLPEVFQAYSNVITLTSDEGAAQPLVTEYREENGQTVCTMKYHGPDMRPYIRFLLAKELFRALVKTKNPVAARFVNAPDEVIDIQANIFAGMILIPGTMLRKEVESINSSLDIIMQLAETFWVSKTLMNQRLRDYMENLT